MRFLKPSDNSRDDLQYDDRLPQEEAPSGQYRPHAYLMEDERESVRLEVKTRPKTVRRQARWCGLRPGLRVLDAGCGPGKVTSILHEMIQPGGTILGVDYSKDRIRHAEEHYGDIPGVDFQIHDLRDPLEGVGRFDLIWVRFVLEHNLLESSEIVRNLTACLKPDGYLCLLDLDHNCLSHHELPREMEHVLFRIMERLETEYNFDPYSGRKLYSYMYDLGYRNIQLEVVSYNLIYGAIGKADLFNWRKKTEIALMKMKELFEDYPGGRDGFLFDFDRFFSDPRRFTYTPLIMCKGMKPKLS